VLKRIYLALLAIGLCGVSAWAVYFDRYAVSDLTQSGTEGECIDIWVPNGEGRGRVPADVLIQHSYSENGSLIAQIEVAFENSAEMKDSNATLMLLSPSGEVQDVLAFANLPPEVGSRYGTFVFLPTDRDSLAARNGGSIDFTSRSLVFPDVPDGERILVAMTYVSEATTTRLGLSDWALEYAISIDCSPLLDSVDDRDELAALRGPGSGISRATTTLTMQDRLLVESAVPEPAGQSLRTSTYTLSRGEPRLDSVVRFRNLSTSRISDLLSGGAILIVGVISGVLLSWRQSDPPDR
jgi:hypothetical protein